MLLSPEHFCVILSLRTFSPSFLPWVGRLTEAFSMHGAGFFLFLPIFSCFVFQPRPTLISEVAASASSLRLVDGVHHRFRYCS